MLFRSVYERVCNYDGSTSKTLKEFLNAPPEKINVSFIYELLSDFKQNWLRECIVTSDVDLVNFLVQEESPSKATVKIVDNIGTPVMIPLAYYFEHFAKKRAKKYWHRFVARLQQEHPQVLWPELFVKLDEC